MFMAVAAAALGPRFPRWVLMWDASEEEVAEARASFGEPYNVVAAAQIQVERRTLPPIPGRWRAYEYSARRVSWDMCGPKRAATIAGLVEQCPSFKAV